MKLRLGDDYAIHYPIALCEPLNADFDGDQVQVQLVPESVAEETYQKLSPRYVIRYKKNGQTILPINHETLNGLAVATEYTPDRPEDMVDPKHVYTDYVQLLKDVEVDKKIKLGTPIVFTGNIDGEEYNTKITSYGRLRISKILGGDIDNMGFAKDPKVRFGAKEAAKLSTWLSNREDGVEMRQALQKFCLRAVTIAGVVTFDYKTLYANCDTETYRKIRNIADSTELTDKQKTLLLTEEYDKYEKEIQDSYSADLKNELSRAARVKLDSISAMSMPQLIISGVDEKPIITNGTLVEGYNEEDYIYHSIENRSLQGIKQSGVFNGYQNDKRCPLKIVEKCWKKNEKKLKNNTLFLSASYSV